MILQTQRSPLSAKSWAQLTEAEDCRRNGILHGGASANESGGLLAVTRAVSAFQAHNTIAMLYLLILLLHSVNSLSHVWDRLRVLIPTQLQLKSV